MNYDEFLASLSGQIYEYLAGIGFVKESEELFVRFNQTHEINVVSIQKHSSESKVCINLGVHYDFLPKVGSIDLPDFGDIDLPDCEIKERLTSSSAQEDQWWDFSANSVDEIVSLVTNGTEEFFRLYSLDGDISSFRSDELKQGVPAIMSSVTKVRTCLILARVQETLGNLEEAVAMAKLGISIAGMAVGPKKALKGVVKRVEGENVS